MNRIQPILAHWTPRIGYYGRLARGDWPHDAVLLLWPVFWATAMASQGLPSVSALVAFLFTLLLLRSALAIAVAHHNVTRLTPRRRDEGHRVIATLFVLGLCFALPLGWPGLLLPLGLLFLLLYRLLRDRSYSAQIWLALGFAWPAFAVYAVQAEEVTKTAWLPFLGAACWALSLMILRQWPTGRGEPRSLAILFGRQTPVAVSALALAALLILWLAGRQLELGIFFHIGLWTALALSVWQQLLVARSGTRGIRPALQAAFWWGAAVQAGVLFHFICKSG